MSIKNKLVTAVTTAGLLAGLFGSAFVPAARAAFADGSKDFFSLDTRVSFGSTALISGTKSAVETGAVQTVTAKALGSGYLMFVNGSMSNVSNLAARTAATGTAAAATTSTWTATGTCEFEAVDGVGTGATDVVQTTLTASSVVLTADADAGNEDVFTAVSVQVEVTGSGTCTITQVLSAGNADAQTWTIYTGYANAAAATAVSTVHTTVTEQTKETAGGRVQTTNGLPTILSKYDTNAAMTAPNAGSGHLELSLVVKDATGQALGAVTAGDQRLVCSVTAGNAYIDAANTDRVGGAATAGSAATIRAAGLTSETVGNGAAGVYSCAIVPAALTTTGTATFKIATVAGVTLATQEVQFLGPVDSVTLSAPAALAVGNAAVADALSVTIKDAAGVAYTGTTTTSSAGRAVLVEANVVETYTDTNAAATAVGAAADGDEKITLDANTCAASDYGRSIKLVYTDSTSGNDKTSTATIKCVKALAKITAMAAKVGDPDVDGYGDAPSTTSCAAGQSISFEFTATDNYSDIAPRGFTGPDLTVIRSWTTNGATGALVFYGGVAQYDVTCPSAAGTHWVSFSLADNDAVASGSQAYLTAKHVFTVTDPAGALTDPSIAARGKKVTATFPNLIRTGIKFEVENAITGVVRTYNRKTDATGKATYTVAGRGTFYITAMKSDGSVITETVTVKR